jgi:hypothetical protein
VRFLYADPPYPGQAKRLYGDHPDYAGEVDHAELIERLEREFPDGWALSTSVPALGEVLSLCPAGEFVRAGQLKAGSGIRLCSWVRKPMPMPPARVMWTWEPLIIRTPNWRQRSSDDFIADSLRASPPTRFLGGTITGQKPKAFCYWVFDLLGARPGDELVDIFPGSGAVGHEWNAFQAQGRLVA